MSRTVPSAELFQALEEEIAALKDSAARHEEIITSLKDAVAQQALANEALKATLNEAVIALKESTTQQDHLVDTIAKVKQKMDSQAQPQQTSTSGVGPLPSTRRTLVVCIDGTSNQFSVKNTNVVELYHRLIQDEHQLTFYNSGIGTYATPSWRSLKFYKQVVDNKIDLAIAWNFEHIVLSAYRWLAENYEDGDLIFLFGFSRGAYQIRTLSAMIDSVGLIRKGNQDQIPFAYELYAETKKLSPKKSIFKRYSEVMLGRSRTMSDTADIVQGAHIAKMCRRFKETFSRRDVKVYFVGAWDTVSSVGLIRSKTLPGTTEGMHHVTYFRHALALHERRVKFLHENVRGGLGPSAKSTRGEQPHTKEVWFAGSHGDIGGGTVSNLDMDQFGPALRWMLFEAAVAGLRFSGAPQQWENDRSPEVHNALTGVWHALEYLPLARLDYRGTNSITSWPHRARPRQVQPNQLIHSTALDAQERWRASLPENIEWNRDSLTKINMLEEDPYTDAKKLMARLSILPLRILKDHDVAALKVLISTVSGIRSLRDTPGAEAVLMALVGLYSDSSDDFRIVADAALLALDIEAAEKAGDKYYPTNQLRSVIARASDTGRSDLSDRIENAFGPAQIRPPLVHPRDVWRVACIPNSDQIVSGCTDGALRIWDKKPEGTLVREMTGHSSALRSVAVSSDGSKIVSGSSDRSIRVWSTETGTEISRMSGGNYWPYWVGFSPDAKRIVSASSDMMIRLWDLETGTIVVGPLFSRSYSATYSPDATKIVSCSSGGPIRVWDAETGAELWMTQTPSTVYSVAYSPNGSRIAAGGIDKVVLVLDAATGVIIRTLEGHTDWVMTVAFSHSGAMIVSGSKDRTIRLWNADTGARIDVLRGHSDRVNAVEFSSDDKQVISASDDKTVRIWDATGAWGRR